MVAAAPLGLANLIRNLTSDSRLQISGYNESSVYSGSLYDNNNQEQSFRVAGIGPMMSNYLGSIERNLSLLSFVFASSQDLELKNESEDNMTAIGDSLLIKILSRL